MGVIVAANLLLLLVSCRKQSDPISSLNTASRKTDKNLLAKFPPQNQRLIYNLLTATEKSDLWAYHLVEGCAQINANKVQKQFIESLVSRFTADFFNQTILNEGYSIIKLSQEANKLFTKDEYVYLFFTLEANYKTFLTNYHREGDQEQDFGSLDKSKCGCSTKSDFCTGVLHCAPADCITSSAGCGFLFFFSCNGICS